MKEDLSSFGLQDQVAIVTGASQGIGQAIAIGLAKAGAHVALVARSIPRLQAVATQIESLGRRAAVVPADLTAVAEIEAMVTAVQESFDRIDILVNNAAWTDTVPALEVTEGNGTGRLTPRSRACFSRPRRWQGS